MMLSWGQNRDLCLVKVTLTFCKPNCNHFILKSWLIFLPKLKKFPQWCCRDITWMEGRTTSNHNASSDGCCLHTGIIKAAAVITHTLLSEWLALLLLGETQLFKLQGYIFQTFTDLLERKSVWKVSTKLHCIKYCAKLLFPICNY